MIQENRYSHASDVCAFGIFSWELYSAFAAGQQNRDTALPYNNIPADKVSSYL